MSGCKIGKIKMKNGGAPLYLIHSQKKVKTDSELVLEEALEMVRSGFIIELAIIATVVDERITTTYSEGMLGNIYSGVAACEILKNRLLETLK
ncbi:hypothetical protein [Dyadobacter sp. CY356]|uniref:hypothetical protein n=1 Tax=Dyadobacter sp. CY356 TaxID=2906442 RepID=UPI001F32D2D3|nr:hypothetical protein [Dyadobacter sp. CY356]MCF0055516.1 hypothetical protein [Dyadobacter sp. CY356]